MKKLISFTLVFVLLAVFTLTACGSKSSSAAVAGTWKCPVSCSKLLDAVGKEGSTVDALTDAVSKSLDGITVDLILELKADGTFTFGADESIAKSLSESLRERISEILPDLAANLLGISKEVFEAQQALTGLSLDDMLSKYFGDFNVDGILDSIKIDPVEGTYTYEEGKLTLKNGELSGVFNVKLSDNELKITGSEKGAAFLMKYLLPLVFTR